MSINGTLLSQPCLQLFSVFIEPCFLLWGSWRYRYYSCASSIPACGSWWDQVYSLSHTTTTLEKHRITKAAMLVSSLVGANISVVEYNKWSGDGELRSDGEVLRSGAKWMGFVGWRLITRGKKLLESEWSRKTA